MSDNDYQVSAGAYPGSELDQATIIGSIDIPAVSYGGDSIIYDGPIDRLFYSVTGWDEFTEKPIGDIPEIYANQSAFDVRVVDQGGCVLKSVIALVTNVYAYTLGVGNYVRIKFGYREIPKTAYTGELFHLDPTIAHIYKDPTSELLAIVLEGHPDACVGYMNKHLMHFVHNGTVYHWKSSFKYKRRIGRDLNGLEQYEDIAVVVIAHPDLAVSNFDSKLDTFKNRTMGYITKIYGVPVEQ